VDENFLLIQSCAGLGSMKNKRSAEMACSHAKREDGKGAIEAEQEAILTL
jgi:hypothetical protein